MVLTYIMIMGGIIYNYDEYSIADLSQRRDIWRRERMVRNEDYYGQL